MHLTHTRGIMLFGIVCTVLCSTGFQKIDKPLIVVDAQINLLSAACSVFAWCPQFYPR